MPVTMVISGGQTGVDQAALRAALDCGLTTGGWCPPDGRSDAGEIPPEFHLQKTPLDRSPDAPEVPRSQRTEWNVRDSDATLILLPRELPFDPGTEWTWICAVRSDRPLFVCDPADPESPAVVSAWLDERAIRTLNVAGPSERTAPGIGDLAYAFLVRVFSARRRPHPP